MKTSIQLEFAEEPITFDIVEEISSLTINHWVEVGRRDLPFSPDWTIYINAGNKGVCRLFTARAEGMLVGYAVFAISPHPHYRGVTLAGQDVLFLDKGHRAGRAGIDFIRFCDGQLSVTGIDVVQQHVTFQRDFGPVLERIGYQPVSTLYERRIS